MIQFNLLPDVKLEFIKVRQTQRAVIGASLMVMAGSVFVLLILGGIVFIFQKQSMSHLSDDIVQSTNQLKSTKGLNDILTVQSQLKALPGVMDARPAATRLFGYIQQMTPPSGTISQLNVDYGEHKMTITGNAGSLDVVNTFTDQLKMTNYGIAGSYKSKGAAFSKVILAQFSRNSSGATYTITTTFDPAIFNGSQDIELTAGAVTGGAATTGGAFTGTTTGSGSTNGVAQ